MDSDRCSWRHVPWAQQAARGQGEVRLHGFQKIQGSTSTRRRFRYTPFPSTSLARDRSLK